jgi:serine/threonine protein kinase
MTDVSKCSRCGEPLLPGTLGGNCLRCLLGFGLAPAGGESGEGKTPCIPAEQIGDRIGPYELLEKIGEGGCGVVYLARQDKPVRRRFALKIIKLGMDTKKVIARFEAERQALAHMDHPNIAKFLDAGATENGRPYFVMELVEGQKITDYCDEKRLSTVARMKIFLQVCDAVHHAHQKGVIHRDIKPANILITERNASPIPKVIDFGIAKAITDQPLTDDTCFTAFDQFIGTPAYMSPEQAGLNARMVDCRSDIYSLGILLYELLTGKPPFDADELRRAALDEVLRSIREREPPRPSTRLTALQNDELTRVAARRQVGPARLPQILRGDLDCVVMKSLEKDTQDRYQAVADLAGDVERFLANKPVIAHPPSIGNRLGKTILRNRKELILSAGAVAAVLLILLPAWHFDRREQARRAVNALPLGSYNVMFTSNATGSWRYSELAVQHPQNPLYFPTSAREFAAARFQGYASYRDCAGWSYPVTDAGPAFFDWTITPGYKIFTTWILSATNRTLNVVCTGDDGHSLFVDGKFLAGGGHPDIVTASVELKANIPRQLTLAVYNSEGGWAGYVGLGPWHGFVEGNWTNLLNNVPGLLQNADGFSQASRRSASR